MLVLYATYLSDLQLTLAQVLWNSKRINWWLCYDQSLVPAFEKIKKDFIEGAKKSVMCCRPSCAEHCGFTERWMNELLCSGQEAQKEISEVLGRIWHFELSLKEQAQQEKVEKEATAFYVMETTQQRQTVHSGSVNQRNSCWHLRAIPGQEARKEALGDGSLAAGEHWMSQQLYCSEN